MPTSSSTSPTRDATNSGGVVKHRACDECRTRKLACSKEPDGCSRCRREGLTCVYSAQKPMGRPRKRRAVEDLDEPQAASLEPAVGASFTDAVNADASSSVNGSSQFPVTTQQQQQQQQPGDPWNFDYAAFYDTADYSNMDDPYGDGGVYTQMNGLPPQSDSQIDPVLADIAPGYTEPRDPVDRMMHVSGHGVDLLGDINFDDEDPANLQVSEDIDKTARELLSFSAAQEEEEEEEANQATEMERSQQRRRQQQQTHDTYPQATPGLTNNSTPPSTAPSHTSSSSSPDASRPEPCTYGLCVPKSIRHATCACLSQIYLAMDSLTRLPEDIGEAMRVARMATKTAHDVVMCPVCSAPLSRPTAAQLPPIQSFQSLMMLGAFVPTIANAYVHMLEMVDDTTAAAKAKGDKILFNLPDYGGLWSKLSEVEHSACRATKRYMNKEMNPDHWRLTVRALLKVDVYGVQLQRRTTEDGSHVSHRHLGLKDIATAMEERSNRRHDDIEAMVAAGEPYPHKDPRMNLLMPDMPPGHHHPKKEDRQCLKIVEIARVSLDKLVIS